MHAARGYYSWWVVSKAIGFNYLDSLLVSALESAHAIWGGLQVAKTLPKDQDVVIVCAFSLRLGSPPESSVQSVPLRPW